MTNFPQFLIDGHTHFKEKTYPENRQRYEELAKGQTPKVLLVGCSDSRVDPITIFGAEPGDLFIVRNVANIVPPYETEGAFHGVSAALEFGIMHLEIEHVVVLGHAGCGGIKAMMDPETEFRSDMVFISDWVKMMSDDRDAVLAEMPHASMGDKLEALELRAINSSINNLRGFPFVKSKEDAGELALHGAYFDVSSGSLFALDTKTNQFNKI